MIVGIGINLVKSPKIKNYPTTNLLELINKNVNKLVFENELKLLFAGIISGLVAWLIHSNLDWGSSGLELLVKVIISSTFSIGFFYLIADLLAVQEVKDLIVILRKKIIHH